MGEIRLGCLSNVDTETNTGVMELDVSTVILTEMGASNTEAVAKLPYFVVITDPDKEILYREELNLSEQEADLLFHHIKDSQDILDGSVELLERLHDAGYPLFALTDNVHEIVWYLKRRYDFWKYFKGVVVSAEVNCLKPNPDIFYHLLESNGLEPSETVFLDDMPANVQGARNVGMEAIQFQNADKCTDELKEKGLSF